MTLSTITALIVAVTGLLTSAAAILHSVQTRQTVAEHEANHPPAS